MPPATILVVDDEEGVRTVIARTLEGTGRRCCWRPSPWCWARPGGPSGPVPRSLAPAGSADQRYAELGERVWHLRQQSRFLLHQSRCLRGRSKDLQTVARFRRELPFLGPRDGRPPLVLVS